MYATLNFETKGTKAIEVTLVPSDHSPFFVIELRDDGGLTTIMFSPDQLSQIITAATAAYTEWQPPVAEAEVVELPKCSTCEKRIAPCLYLEDEGRYDWAHVGNYGSRWGCGRSNDADGFGEFANLDGVETCTDFAKAHPELVVE